MVRYIGIDFSNIRSANDVINFVDSYSRNEILTFLPSYSAISLGNHNEGSDKPATTNGVPDIRRIFGAGLKVLSGSASKVSEDTKFYANIVFNHVKRFNFTLYSVVEAILTYVCLKS